MPTANARQVEVQGVSVPTFLYGTAWKEDATRRLVRLALQQGFRGFDTANQRKHYHEAGVGEALMEAIAGGSVTRDDLFLQTKFTHRPGQDHRLPYDDSADVATQVVQSFESSLTHLGVDRLDSYVLHGPSARRGLDPVEDVPAWRAMESLFDGGRTRLLGVSNVTLEQLQALCGLAKVRPAFVQNRCYARTGWDRAIRSFCKANGILYQGFSLLTANQQVLTHKDVVALARREHCTSAQIVFRFARAVGMVCLTGTSQAEHMQQDLAAMSVELSDDDVRRVERIVVAER